jgi:hypothetical protein
MQCSYYWVLNPIPERIIDNESRIPSLENRINYNGKEYKIAILSDDHGRPELIRLVIPELQEEAIPESLLPLIQSVREHMLTTLRLSYDPRTSLFDFHLRTFQPDGSPSTINVEAQLHYNPVFDAPAVRNLFAASLNHREQFRLLSNGANEGIPVQYRFLSLYKLIEMKFRHKGKWKKDELRKFVSRFEAHFNFKGINSDPVKAIHECRDKCAHIRTGKNHEVLGVSELNHKQAVFVMKILPIMTRMGAEILSEQTSGNVVIQTVDRIQLWDDQAMHHLLKQHDVPEKQRQEFQNILDELQVAKLAQKASLLKKGEAWIVKNQEFLGASASIIRKALGLGE